MLLAATISGLAGALLSIGWTACGIGAAAGLTLAAPVSATLQFCPGAWIYRTLAALAAPRRVRAVRTRREGPGRGV
jgi:hypothetical protein